MKGKYISLFAISFALLLATISFASAAVLDITNITHPSTVAHNQNTFTFTFTINYTGAEPTTSVDFGGSTLTSGSGSVTIPTTALTQGQPQLVTGTVSFSAFQTGSLTVNIVADPSAAGSNVAVPFTVPISNSAQLDIVKSQEVSKTVNGTFIVKNTGNQLLSNILLSVSGDFSATLSSGTITNLAPNAQSSLIQLIPNLASTLRFGPNTVTVTATDQSTGATTTEPFTIQGSFCNNGQVGSNLSISSVTIRNTGDEDETWNPLDQVSVTVDVENNGLADMREVFVKIGLFDSSGSNKIKNVDFSSNDDEEISIGTINDGGSEKVRFEFTIPVDLKEGSYKLAVKAFSKRSGESKDCADTFDQSNYQTISVEKRTKEGELIAISNFQVPDQNICGATLSGSFDIANVGDQDQDQVLVKMRSPDLGIDQEFETRENLDTGDIRTFNFDIPIPSTLKDGSYRVYFRSTYDYRNGAYHESTKDETEEVVKVIGCSSSSSGSIGQNAAITATLGSDAKAGEKLVVNGVIRNVGTTQQTFVVDATGYQSWANLDDISSRVITLGAGESKIVTVTLTVNKDAEGSEGLTLQATTNGKTDTQDIEVPIKAAASSSSFSLAGSGLLWVIGAINLILIILIIVIAIRVSRK